MNKLPHDMIHIILARIGNLGQKVEISDCSIQFKANLAIEAPSYLLYYKSFLVSVAGAVYSYIVVRDFYSS